ncbi:MAG: hypothetical protein R3C26_12415 [Calditrichia bacterium]
MFNKELTLPEKETPMISAQCYNIVVSYVIWLNILDIYIYFVKSNVFCAALVGFAGCRTIVGYQFFDCFFQKIYPHLLFEPCLIFCQHVHISLLKAIQVDLIYAFQWQFLIGAIIVCGLYLVILNDSFKNVKPGENSPGRSTIILAWHCRFVFIAHHYFDGNESKVCLDFLDKNWVWCLGYRQILPRLLTDNLQNFEICIR